MCTCILYRICDYCESLLFSIGLTTEDVAE
jgi:hypothetical protein